MDEKIATYFNILLKISVNSEYVYWYGVEIDLSKISINIDFSSFVLLFSQIFSNFSKNLIISIKISIMLVHMLKKRVPCEIIGFFFICL